MSINHSDTEVKLVVADPVAAMEPTWAPDGQSLAFVSFRTGREQIFVMDRKTGSVINVTKSETHERSPAWSPDGLRIAFTSARTGDQDIYVMRPDGSDVRNLTNNAGYDADPVWSPDGKRIAYASARDGRPFRLFVMNSDGTEQRPLSDRDLRGWLFPDWSPDGAKIVVGAYDGSAVLLHILDIASGEFSSIGDPKGVNSYARWSPDGKLISYVHFNSLPRAYVAGAEKDTDSAGGDLMIYEVSTKQHRRVTFGDLPSWGPLPAWQPIGAVKTP